MLKVQFALSAVFLTLLFSACSKPELPYLLRLEQVKFQKGSQEMIELKAMAVYHNPNPIKGRIVRSEFDVFLEEKLLSHVEQKLSVAVPAASDFSLPIHLSFNQNKLIKDKKELLLSAAHSLLNQELALRYKGHLTLDILGKEIQVPLEYSEKLELGEVLKMIN